MSTSSLTELNLIPGSSLDFLVLSLLTFRGVASIGIVTVLVFSLDLSPQEDCI